MGALVMLVRWIVVNGKIDVVSDYLFSGTPTEAAQTSPTERS
ncbi:MAG TPA: hypothetical protein VHW64_02960 [Nocardioides sp.]|nr:hypothetical protein [Nocardioides sp.]HEX3929637.1 hypothetical protein [Nocardioides sp.]